MNPLEIVIIGGTAVGAIAATVFEVLRHRRPGPYLDTDNPPEDEPSPDETSVSRTRIRRDGEWVDVRK